VHNIWAKTPKTLAPEDEMYRSENKKQQKLSDFYLPFGGHLKEDNRWVILSKMIPWDELEKDYESKFSSEGMGAPAKSLRVALGSLIIKEKFSLTDEEVVEHIRETPYLQYFLGFEGYRDERPFDPSMMVYFRKRLDGELLQKANELLVGEYQEELRKKKPKMWKRMQKKKNWSERKIKDN
jgi:hypothetical protein